MWFLSLPTGVVFFRCVTGHYVFVDTNATMIKKDNEIIPATKQEPILSPTTPPSVDKESAAKDDGGAAGTTKCKMCGSVFLKSKIESSKNRGMCYSCYSKKVKNKSSIPSVFKNYLVTDENKQSYFLCDLCNFSCEAFSDVFSHHYKTEHPQANLYQGVALGKDDPFKKFSRQKNGVRSYRCDRCQLSCISRNVFAKHYAEHGDKSLLTDTMKIQFKDGKFCCTVCPKSYTKMLSAKKHLKRVHGPKQFHCDVCRKGFSLEHIAREHEKIHDRGKTIMCDVCGQKFRTKTNLKTHLDNNSCSKYTCGWCNQLFHTKVALNTHLINCDQRKANATEDEGQQHNQLIDNSAVDAAKIQIKCDQKTDNLVSGLHYECAKCNKKFKNKLSLRIHIVKEFNLTPYKCFICDRRFPTTVLLKKHLFSCNNTILDNSRGDNSSLVVTCGDSFACKLCGRKCRKIGYLRQHFRLHSKTKPYVCQFCGKSYVMKASFRAHMLSEVNLRKYACSICEKRYNTSSHLTAHIKKHHRLREFKCESCDKEFAYERDLKEHEKTHNEVKMFCCDKCGGFFKTLRYLKVHLERCAGWK